MEFLNFFKGKYFYNLLSLLSGFLLCLFMTKQQCVYIPTEYKTVDTGGWVEHHTDTIVKIVEKEVPVPVTLYKRVETIPQWVRDSLANTNWTIHSDTIMIEDTVLIGLNYYEDSIRTEDYELKWKAETFGFLTSMIPEITTYNKVIDRWQTKEVPIKYNWTAGIGVSNELNIKGSFGYKGWMIEPEFSKEFKFNQLYLTKQFQF